MRASIVTPVVALLAAAVHAQSTPSVATFISISPSPTTEQVFTIQTSVPGRSSSACYEVCIQEPCPPCGVTSVEGSMGIPPGETPLPSSLVSEVPTIFTNPLRTTESGAAPSATSGASASRSASASGVTSSPSRSGSAPPQQSTAAAPSLNSEKGPMVLALAAFLLV